MNPLLASARLGSGVDLVERAVLSFEQEWRSHGEVRLEQYWPDQCRAQGIDPSDSMAILAELIKADLRLRFDNGQSPTVASYLEQFPKLCQTDSRVLSLIYEEFCLREEGGDAPDVESFCGRYPRWKDSLIAQLQYHRLFSQAAGGRPPAPQFPGVGECFEEFQLVSLLGRGGTSRVFLARDLSLGGKQVVLKVSLDRGDEPKLHGPLDHPHIVPANSVAFQPDKHLRGLSMPYHPGLALDVVLSRLSAEARPRKAIELWHVLVDGSAKSLISSADPKKEALLTAEVRRAGPRGDGWEGFPVRGTFAQGAAWLAMIVARALHYAHGMGTYHRDVKPGNVLLTLRHGPLLFDFNLAESPHSAQQAQEAIHGGTLPYMAPEQIEAFLNPKLWGKVSARADVYSLGLVLRELLTGQMPELPDEKLAPARAMRQVLDRRPLLETKVRRIDPRIPHALEAIVTKCLAVSPDDRYRDAHALAQDLERFLGHQPLLHATNPSSRERLTNWGRRHRWILLSATANLILLGVLLRKPIADRFLPPVHSQPAFQAAILHLQQNNCYQAIRSLESLLPSYSENVLVRSYLAFALDRQGGMTRESDAELRKALSSPDSNRRLLDWGSKDPELGDYLETFAVSRIKEAEDKAAFELFGEDEEREYLAAHQESFKLAAQALRFLELLGRDSLELQIQQAKVEEFRGNYSGALTRLSRTIDAAAQTEAPPNAPDDDLALDTLYACHAIRCRVAIRGADQSRRNGFLSDASAGLDLLQKAEEDLRFCKKFLDSRSLAFGLGSPRFKKFEFLKNKLGLKLTQVELELDLGMISDARRHLEGKGGAKEMKTAVSIAASSNGLQLPKMERVSKRLTDALDRLHVREADQKVEARPSPDQTAESTKEAG
ncbi:MAG: serine/threonine protein kinase [Isosphaeraceae bacterium]